MNTCLFPSLHNLITPYHLLSLFLLCMSYIILTKERFGEDRKGYFNCPNIDVLHQGA